MSSAFLSQSCNLWGPFLRTSVHLYGNSTWLWSIDLQTQQAQSPARITWRGADLWTPQKCDHSNWRKSHLGRAGGCDSYCSLSVFPGKPRLWGVTSNPCVGCSNCFWATLSCVKAPKTNNMLSPDQGKIITAWPAHISWVQQHDETETNHHFIILRCAAAIRAHPIIWASKCITHKLYFRAEERKVWSIGWISSPALRLLPMHD